jgi:hypothetical protein
MTAAPVVITPTPCAINLGMILMICLESGKCAAYIVTFGTRAPGSHQLEPTIITIRVTGTGLAFPYAAPGEHGVEGV